MKAGKDGLPSLLFFLLFIGWGVWEVDLLSTIDLARLTGFSLAIGLLDAGTLTSISYVLDPILGDIFGLLGLRGAIFGVSLLGLARWMAAYFLGIRKS